jgi:dCMP deaminase
MHNLTRPSADDYFMNLAFHVATRGSCARRKVGCILVDEHRHILATGYNGRPSGFQECLDHPCEGADAPSGTMLNKCQAIHAEANALLQCSDVQKIAYAYVTASPCNECVKLLLNTSCGVIVFGEEYPHNEAKHMWLSQKRGWRQSAAISSYSDAIQTVQFTSNSLY